MYYGISQTTLEEGSFDAAFDWINKSLMVCIYMRQQNFFLLKDSFELCVCVNFSLII